jgi:hypothetical protein
MMKGVANILGYGVLIALALLLSVGLGIIAIAPILYFTFVDADARALKANAIVATTLMADETVIAQSIQRRPFALFHRRKVVAITTSRIIMIARGLFGGFQMGDIQWKDLRDARIEQNVLPEVCGSNLAFRHSNMGVAQLSVDGIESTVASTIYARAQSEEQAWEEKRRVRAMEEVRAAAGGVTVHTSQPSGSAPVPAGNRMIAEIRQAKAMLDDGTISDAEFQEMKSKILAQ